MAKQAQNLAEVLERLKALDPQHVTVTQREEADNLMCDALIIAAPRVPRAPSPLEIIDAYRAAKGQLE